MTRRLLQNVDEVRRGLVFNQVGRAVLLSIGSAILAVITVRLVLVSMISVSPVVSTSVRSVLVTMAGFLSGCVAWWIIRPRYRPSMSVAALWIEERRTASPTFELVTWVEQAGNQPSTDPGDSRLAAAACHIADQVSFTDAIDRARWQEWRGPLIFVIAGMLLVVMSAVTDNPFAVTPKMPPDDALIGSTTIEPLGAWSVHVVLPSYVGGESGTVDNVGSVSVLAGSLVVLEGEGAPPQVQGGRVGDVTRRSMPVDEAPGRWRVRVTADSLPTSLRVQRGGVARLLIIEGYPDTIPVVNLNLPGRDSVLRVAQGTLSLEAAARDDHGLRGAWFELIISSGEGERFTVRTVTTGMRTWSAGSSQRDATLTATLDLVALKLMPGDVVHLRAAARDGYPSPARDAGISETRSFRIARANENDSVAVEPVPPTEVEKSLLSQRMLLMLTEKLDSQQVRLVRTDVVRESQRLARDQARIRQAVSDVIFLRRSGEPVGEHVHFAGDGHDHGADLPANKLTLGTAAGGMLEEGDDSPVIDINKPLLEAYNAMWDAGRALEQADPRGAILPMRLALQAIERSRTASRVYLRGRPPQVIIDIDRVRLTGKDTGQSTQRSPRPELPALDIARSRRLSAIAELLAASGVTANAQGSVRGAALSDVRQAARDSLALLRAESLRDAPVFAAALGRVLEGLDSGGDLRQLFIDARRAIGGVERATAGHWSRALPP